MQCISREFEELEGNKVYYLPSRPVVWVCVTMSWDRIQFQCAMSTEKIVAVLRGEHSHFFRFDVGFGLSQPLNRLTFTLHG